MHTIWSHAISVTRRGQHDMGGATHRACGPQVAWSSIGCVSTAHGMGKALRKRTTDVVSAELGGSERLKEEGVSAKKSA
eukprot:3941710-Rhodomonas_salina.1